MNVSAEDSSTFFACEERSSTRKSQTFVATGSCLFYHCLVKHKQKNDCAQHNKFGMSFVGQVVWDTEPVFFFLWAFCFFFARPRRFGEKKVTRNIEKKAHGLIWKSIYWGEHQRAPQSGVELEICHSRYIIGSAEALPILCVSDFCE